jgi:hypothetical protein
MMPAFTAFDSARQRYAGIYTLIINNFAEPSETPDDNALQVCAQLGQ